MIIQDIDHIAEVTQPRRLLSLLEKNTSLPTYSHQMTGGQ